MAAITISGKPYLGFAGILPGACVQPDANVTADTASAIAAAWRMADTRGGIPHVYEVGNHGGGLVVPDDVLISGSLAWDALNIADPCPA
jgi:hypothetical protein